MSEDLQNNSEFQCIFCTAGIIDEAGAVVLSGVWMPNWNNGTYKGVQLFWAHSECLKSQWKGTYPWEPSVLFGQNDDGTMIDWDDTDDD